MYQFSQHVTVLSNKSVRANDLSSSSSKLWGRVSVKKISVRIIQIFEGLQPCFISFAIYTILHEMHIHYFFIGVDQHFLFAYNFRWNSTMLRIHNAVVKLITQTANTARITIKTTYILCFMENVDGTHSWFHLPAGW